jgi:16S rRNA C1402 N4-methylase RsmH
MTSPPSHTHEQLEQLMRRAEIARDESAAATARSRQLLEAFHAHRGTFSEHAQTLLATGNQMLDGAMHDGGRDGSRPAPRAAR